MMTHQVCRARWGTVMLDGMFVGEFMGGAATTDTALGRFATSIHLSRIAFKHGVLNNLGNELLDAQWTLHGYTDRGGDLVFMVSGAILSARQLAFSANQRVASDVTFVAAAPHSKIPTASQEGQEGASPEF